MLFSMFVASLGGNRDREFIDFFHLPRGLFFVTYLFEDSAPYFFFNSPGAYIELDWATIIPHI